MSRMHRVDIDAIGDLKLLRKLGYDVIRIDGDRVVVCGSHLAKRAAAWASVGRSSLSVAEKREIVRKVTWDKFAPYASPHLSDSIRVLKYARALGYTIKGAKQ